MKKILIAGMLVLSMLTAGVPARGAEEPASGAGFKLSDLSKENLEMTLREWVDTAIKQLKVSRDALAQIMNENGVSDSIRQMIKQLIEMYGKILEQLEKLRRNL